MHKTRNSIFIYFSKAALFNLNIYLFRGEGRKRGRETPRETETSIDCVSYILQLGTKPATHASVLTRNQTGNLLLCRTMPNQLSHISPGEFQFFKCWVCRNYYKGHMDKTKREGGTKGGKWVWMGWRGRVGRKCRQL